VIEIISRFRVEAVGRDKDALIEELSEAVGHIAKALQEVNGQGVWECTDDVISQVKTYSAEHREVKPTGNFRGRMVMVFRSYTDG
jgi:hypothetical protein